jgi:hypothetical protein
MPQNHRRTALFKTHVSDNDNHGPPSGNLASTENREWDTPTRGRVKMLRNSRQPQAPTVGSISLLLAEAQERG